jgi:NO-binding membrane sensor protein with MHYT domain
MNKIAKRDAIGRHLKYIALFSHLGFILTGACFAALGVLGMHYLGMLAQRSNAALRFDGDIVMLSCLIALFTATAAFWILFRAVRFIGTLLQLDLISVTEDAILCMTCS